jgi:hypothetical protein
MKKTVLLGTVLVSLCFNLPEAAILRVELIAKENMAISLELLETGETVITDTNGIGTFFNITPDVYTVCAGIPGTAPFCREATIAETDSITRFVIVLDSTAENRQELSAEVNGSKIPDEKIKETVTENEEIEEKEDSTAYTLQKMTVTGKSLEKRALGKQTISQEAIKKLPGLAEPDVMRTIQMLPGVVASSDFSTKLYVRGGNADQNLILLDNAVIYSPSHLFGLFSAFAVDAIKEMEFYKGGFPPQFGNRLSSVLDIKQRSAKPGWLHGYTGVSLLSAKAGLEGTFPKGSWNIHGRRTYIDKVTELMDSLNIIDMTLPYYFYDGQGYADYAPTNNTYFSYTFYGNKDYLNFEPLLNLYWGNLVQALNYSYQITDVLSAKGTAGLSKFDQEVTIGDFITFRNGIKDTTAKQVFLLKPDKRHEFSLGLQATGLGVEFSEAFSIMDLNITDLSYARLLSAFVQHSWDLPEPLNITYGIRGTRYWPTENYGFEPRVSLTYSLNDDTQLMAHWGRYQQYLTSIVFGDMEMPTDFWYAIQGDMPTPTSHLVTGGIKRDLKNYEYRATFEIYHKTFKDLPVFNTTPDTTSSVSEQMGGNFWDQFYTGDGYAFGGEWMLEKNFGLIDGYVSYALSFSILKTDSVFWANWDKRHSVNTVLNFNWSEHFKKEQKLLFSSHLAGTFGSGLPYDEILGVREDRLYGSMDNMRSYIYGRHNNSRYPFYRRIDITPVRLEYKGKRIGWSAFWQIVNIADWENVYMYNYDLETDPPEREQVTMLPRIPIFIGFELKF